MKQLQISETFNIGSLPRDLCDFLIQAVRSVPQTFFFDGAEPLEKEVVGVDKAITSALEKYGWKCQKDYAPISDCGFNVDLAVAQHKVLIEIEKGKSPRLELDILKIASACLTYPEQWQFGALIVPSSYIKLALAGRQTPYQYLQRLTPLIEPVLHASRVKGFLVIGYSDPRGNI